MAKKTCPKCKKQHGTRKKVCGCSHSFMSRVEPGGWVNDTLKGMPKVEMPSPLPNGPIVNDDVRDYIAYEGLGYCIYDYIPAEGVKDQKLRVLWRIARKAMQNIVTYLED